MTEQKVLQPIVLPGRARAIVGFFALVFAALGVWLLFLLPAAGLGRTALGVVSLLIGLDLAVSAVRGRMSAVQYLLYNTLPI